MKKLLFPSLAVGALILGMPQAQAATMKILTTPIDEFTATNPNPTKITLTGSSTPTIQNFNRRGRPTTITPTRFSNVLSNTSVGSSIIGGERLLTFQRILASSVDRAGTATISPTTQGTTTKNPGTLFVDNGTGFNSITAVTWDGVRTAGLGAAGDFSARDFFNVELEFIDRIVHLALTVTDTSNKTGTLKISNLTSANIGPVLFPFTDTKYAGIDFSKVKSLRLEITGVESFDAEINVFSAQRVIEIIPEPSTLVGTSLILALGALTLKKRKLEL